MKKIIRLVMCDHTASSGGKGKQQGGRYFLHYAPKECLISDLTIAEVLDDPLIQLMLDADGISWNAFAQLLESAARVLAQRKETSARSHTEQTRLPGSHLRCDASPRLRRQIPE